MFDNIVNLNMDSEFDYVMQETHDYVFNESKKLARFQVVDGYADSLVSLLNERFKMTPKIVKDEIRELVFMAFREANKVNHNNAKRWGYIHQLIGQYCFTYAFMRSKGLPSFSFKCKDIEVMDVDGFCNPIKIKMANEE